MTIKEVLITELKKQHLVLSDDEINLAFEKSKLDGSAAYDFDINGMVVDLAFAELLLEVAYVSEEKEDDVSKKYVRDLKGLYSAIMRKWGLVDPFLVVVPKPTVKQVNFFG